MLLGAGNEQASAEPIAQISSPETTSIKKDVDYVLDSSGREVHFAQAVYAPADSQHEVGDVASLPLPAVCKLAEWAGEDAEQTHATSSQGGTAHHCGRIQFSAPTPGQQTDSGLRGAVAGALEHETSREALSLSIDFLATAAQTQAGIGVNSAPAATAPVPAEQQVSRLVSVLRAAGSCTSEVHCAALSPRSRSCSHLKLSGMSLVSSSGNVSELSAIDADGRAASCGPNPVDLPFVSPRKLGPAVGVAGAVGDSPGTFGDSGPSVFHQAYNVEFTGVIS
jgi:hypothetical protein